MTPPAAGVVVVVIGAINMISGTQAGSWLPHCHPVHLVKAGPRHLNPASCAHMGATAQVGALQYSRQYGLWNVVTGNRKVCSAFTPPVAVGEAICSWVMDEQRAQQTTITCAHSRRVCCNRSVALLLHQIFDFSVVLTLCSTVRCHLAVQVVCGAPA